MGKALNIYDFINDKKNDLINGVECESLYNEFMKQANTTSSEGTQAKLLTIKSFGVIMKRFYKRTRKQINNVCKWLYVLDIPIDSVSIMINMCKEYEQ